VQTFRVRLTIGAYYTKGSDKELDEAIAKKDAMEKFLTQDANIQSDFNETLNELIKLMDVK